MTELAAPQISSLMEALPGIAAVLRSPVANAMVALSRAAAGLEEFQLSHGEELLRFGVRRNLLTPEEVDKVLDELRDVAASRPKPPPPPPKKPTPPEADVPKVPHRPKGIQLKPVPKRPPPPPPPPPKLVKAPVAVKKPAIVKKAAAPVKPAVAKKAPAKVAPKHAKPVVHAKAAQKPAPHKAPGKATAKHPARKR